MLASKSKSGLSEVSNNKIMATTPRLGKLPRTKSDTISTSNIQKPRPSVDRSPHSVDSKPPNDRRLPKTMTPEKQPRAPKGSQEPQAKLFVLQEELRKANEQLVLVEAEKLQAQEELKNAKQLAHDANEKLTEALVARKAAEESLEIEKFRNVELEQATMEAAQKREEALEKELESIRNQHAMDAAALTSTTEELKRVKQATAEVAQKREEALEKELESIRNQHRIDTAALASTTEELQRVKQELATATEEKNAALSHTDDVTKIAETNAEKVVFLTEEVARLKTLLDSKLQSVNKETAELVKKLDSEVVTLRCELENAKGAEQKVAEMEALIEQLQIEVSNSKRAEFGASNLAEEWKRKAELLEVRVEETSKSEQASLESQALLTMQVEEANASLQEALSEIVSLKGKVELLETELARQKAELEDSKRLLNAAREEATEMELTINVLKSEFQIVEEAKRLALDNAKAAAVSIESFSKERDNLVNELEMAREEEEKHKKAMEGLVSALHEASREARDLQERLLMKQAEAENARAQVQEFESALKNTKESYQLMLDEAKYEIVCLKKAIDRSEMEAKNSKAEWDAKELQLTDGLRKLEEEIATISSRKGEEHEAQDAKEDGVQVLNNNKLKHAETEVTIPDEVVEELKAESLMLKERLFDKEDELPSVVQQNNDLRLQGAATSEKIKELSALGSKATVENSEVNGEVDTRPKLAANGEGEEEREEKVMDLSSDKELELESIDDELEYKIDGSGSFDQMNGLPLDSVETGSVSPTKQQEQKKKKKALLGKFGGLLKKKSNHK